MTLDKLTLHLSYSLAQEKNEKFRSPNVLGC